MSASEVVRNGAATRFTGRVLLVVVTSLVLIAAACSGEAGVEETAAHGSGALDEPAQPADRPVPPAPPRLPVGALIPGSEVHDGQLDPGTYVYGGVGEQGFNVRFAVPVGWTWNGRYLSKGGVGLPDGAAIFFFGGRVQVYADPCHWAGEHSRPLGIRPAGPFMAALAAQPMRNATIPIDRPANHPSVADRWPGMAVELTVPDNVTFAECDQGQFRSWGPDNNARIHQGPGQRDLVWAVDIDGAGVTGNPVIPPGGLIIDAASFPGTPADVMVEVEAILASVDAGHWG